MGYYSGTANDMGAVRAALVDACVAEGWAWNTSTEVLSKGVLFFRLQVVDGYLTLLGRTSALAGDAPGVVRMGRINNAFPVTYPLEYEVFVFASEVYCVLTYSIDCHIWCAFGRSTVEGMPGTGGWVGASAFGSGVNGVNISPSGGSLYAASYVSCALFWRGLAGSAILHDAWVHSDLDAGGWLMGQSISESHVGLSHLTPLMGLLPNAWNSEAVLLPIRAYKKRPSAKISLVADLENARTTRIDNYTPGQVISIGADRWKIFPWYRKNTTQRDGGIGIDHTGTFGWAIRYEGP